MAAYALLAAKAAHPAPALPGDTDQAPRTDCGMIAPTVPELQRLLTLLLPAPPAPDADIRLRWSHWRRRHQARARWHHYQQRGTLIAWQRVRTRKTTRVPTDPRYNCTPQLGDFIESTIGRRGQRMGPNGLCEPNTPEEDTNP